MSVDPVPTVTESGATGEVAALYAKIRTTLDSPIANLVWRHLATVEGGPRRALGTFLRRVGIPKMIAARPWSAGPCRAWPHRRIASESTMIVAPSADLEMGLPAIVFSAVGTAGQRCTSLRRLIVHEAVYDQLVPRLVSVYEGLPMGDPLADGVLVGPLIDAQALEGMERALAQGIKFEI